MYLYFLNKPLQYIGIKNYKIIYKYIHVQLHVQVWNGKKNM